MNCNFLSKTRKEIAVITLSFQILLNGLGRVWTKFLFQLSLIYCFFAFNACSASIAALIREGKNEEVLLALEKDKSWNKTKECESPLQIASRLGNKELVRSLLSKGADPNQRSIGCPQESVLILEGVLISKDRFFTATDTALSQSANIEVAKILINSGANLNIGGYRQNDPSGKGLALYTSPLLRAILDRKYDLAKYLIQKGAPIDIYNPLTGENELELWFTSVGIRSKKDREFFHFLKSKRLKRIQIPSRILSEKEDQIRSLVHLPTKNQTKVSILSLREHRSLETDLVDSGTDSGSFHASEFIWMDSGQNLYEWILQYRLQRPKKRQ